MRNARIAAILAILLLLQCCVALAAEGNPPSTTCLEITSVTFTPKKSENTIAVTFQNSCEQGIVYAELRFRYYDSNGERIYAFGKDAEGAEAERAASWDYLVFSEGLSAHATDDSFEKSYENYLGADRVEVAIDWVVLADSRRISLREDQLVWMDSKGNTTGQPSDTVAAEALSVETITAAQEVMLGFKYVRIAQYDTPYYLCPSGALMVAITEGSVAEKAGLKKGDVIVLFDGINPINDIYAVERGKTKLLEGESIDVVYVRDGEEHTIRLPLEAE